MKFLFTAISGNKKTGPIPVVTSSKLTCPDACAFKAKGCYASAGALNIHWSRLTNGETGITWENLLSCIRKLRQGTLWRMNQAGDFQGENNLLNADKMRELVLANRGKKAISYSHYPVLDTQSEHAPANRAIVKEANQKGFTINLSGNNIAHADKLIALKIAPVVCVVPSEVTKNFITPAGNRALICPASIRENVNCAACGLCARANREYIICFPAHGNAKRFVNTVANAA